MRVISVVILCFLASWSFGQKAVSKEIASHLASGQTFQAFSPLQFVSENVQDRSYQIDGLSQGTILQIDEQAIADLRNGEHQFIQFSLPSDARNQITLQLVRQEIFTEDFALYTSDQPGIPVAYTPGLHYKGIIEGQPASVVAVSIFDNEIMGLISTPEGNIVLGRMDQDRESRHILYREADLTRKSAFSCETVDDGFGYTQEDLETQPAGRDAGDCVRVYIEIDDDIVTQKGGGAPATNYITGLFNQSITLYANESVNMTISEIYAWTTNSPYSGSSSSQMLSSFQANSGAFNGNIGHLVSYQASGGIAVLDNLCSTNPDWRKCFSSIDASYQNVPTYSWSVMVITHEMGHVIGSKHTHACAWNGNNTAIDGCAGSTEGGCALPPIPEGGGTIMSYCHLTGEGINFNLGFGSQPGNVIRNRVNATGNCLTTCGPPPPPPPPQYCTANGSNSSYEWIQKVVLGSISNTSGNNGGYFDYTALSTNLTAGTAYTIQLTPGFAGQSYLEYWRVWIDYNGDLDWADAGEQVAQGTGSAMISLSFTVPSGTLAGTKRMRVAMKYGGYAASCGTFTYGEVEDYNIIVGGGSGPSCSDGIQNQGETGIDCGGPCPACPTCNDGIQNQGETGVDCGGPCPACPPPPGGEVTLMASYFETGWDNWVDGGADATRVSSTNSWEGSYSIRLADNSTTQSAMTSPGFNLSDATGFEIEFYFKAVGVETGEDFWVRYKNGSNAWVTVGQIIKGTHFENNVFYVATVNVPGFVPTSNGKFRIQCDASDDSDQIYIDQVTITKLTGTALIKEGVTIKPVLELKDSPLVTAESNTIQPSLLVYPNPVHDVLNIGFDGAIENMRLLSLDGQVIHLKEEQTGERELDIQHLAPGLYFLWVQSKGQWYPAKFSKM
jgi:hypothetical protein